MKKVLFGGGFDLLHLGHVLAIQRARAYGDYLIVNVLSDERIRAKKLKTRDYDPNLAPVIPAIERVEMVASLKWVSEVICYYGDPSYPVGRVIEEKKPDVVVLSEGENLENLSEVRKTCKRNGVQIVTIPRFIVPSGLDTTRIIEKIRSGLGRPA